MSLTLQLDNYERIMSDPTPDDENADGQNLDDDTALALAEAAAKRAAQKEDLAQLRLEHRQIDKNIEALILTGAVDMLKIRRMKKVKLAIKDKIAYLEDILTPDIIA